MQSTRLISTDRKAFFLNSTYKDAKVQYKTNNPGKKDVIRLDIWNKTAAFKNQHPLTKDMNDSYSMV